MEELIIFLLSSPTAFTIYHNHNYSPEMCARI